MTISSFLSTMFPTIHNDAPEDKVPTDEETTEAEIEIETEIDADSSSDEPDEPEDVSSCFLTSLRYVILAKNVCDIQTVQEHPIITEECKETPKCAPLAEHFQHCQEKIESGKGFKGEDCVEELCV
jgi:ubiquinol-cytochrome c reductase subunit 6